MPATFAVQLTRRNLTNIQWLCSAGMVYIVLNLLWEQWHPIALQQVTNLNDGILFLCGGFSWGMVWYLRKHPVRLIWTQAFILGWTLTNLAAMDAYYLTIAKEYGQTSIYLMGVIITSVVTTLPPALLLSILAINHGIFLTLLFSRHLPANVTSASFGDDTAGVVIAGVVGWLLYRWQRENFLNELVIRERNEQLESTNRELARLNKLELDQRTVAVLAEEKARLEVLRYQLNPHFLFNALTSIRAQLPGGLTGARAAIERLTDFCQLTLFRPSPAEGDQPTLAQELRMLTAYLEIEQDRWGELLAVELAIDPTVGEERLPAFLLLPLVENALKYGRATSRAGVKIRISVQRDAGGLRIEIANTGEWIETANRGSTPSLGIGLENLRQRLERYYPQRHEFVTQHENGWVRVFLHLSEPAALP